MKQKIKKLINEIEEKKDLSEKLEASYKKRQRDEEENRRVQEEMDKVNNTEWENFRDKRVKNWNRFKQKITKGGRRGKYETKPPKYKTEERTDYVDIYRQHTII